MRESFCISSELHKQFFIGQFCIIQLNQLCIIFFKAPGKQKQYGDKSGLKGGFQINRYIDKNRHRFNIVVLIVYSQKSQDSLLNPSLAIIRLKIRKAGIISKVKQNDIGRCFRQSEKSQLATVTAQRYHGRGRGPGQGGPATFLVVSLRIYCD